MGISSAREVEGFYLQQGIWLPHSTVVQARNYAVIIGDHITRTDAIYAFGGIQYEHCMATCEICYNTAADLAANSEGYGH